MDREIRQWTRCCEPCQRAKVHHHTKSPNAPFPPLEHYFGLLHLDLMGPQLFLNGCEYLLTCIDCYTRWPVAWSLNNIPQ